MAISIYTFAPNGTVNSTSLVKNGATIKAETGLRYRFVDANGNPPKGLKITQLGQDAKVEWIDPDMPADTRASLMLENFNTTEGVAISAPGTASADVQGFQYASDSGLITPVSTGAILPVAAPYISEGLLGSAWFIGGGVAIAGLASGGGGNDNAGAGGAPDTTAPGAPSINTVAPSNNTQPTLTGTAEAGSTVTVVVAGATYTTTVAANGTWTVNTATDLPTAGSFAPNVNGSNTVTATATDVAGNTSSAATGSVTIDTTAPTATITVADTNLMLGEATTVTVTFSEAVTGFSNADIVADNGTLSAFATADGGVTWFATLTPTAAINDATNTVRFATGAAYNDIAGNAGTITATSSNYSIDTAAPVVPSLALAADTGASSTDGITSSPIINVGGIEAGAIWQYSVDGGAWATGSGASITASAGAHTYQVRQMDAAGNLSAASSAVNYTLDTTAPTVSITDPTVGTANITTGAISYTVTLSEASSDFNASDISITGGTVNAASFTAVSPTVYTFTATPTAGTNAGSMVVSVAAGTLHDAASNANTAGSNTQGYDTAAPAASLAFTGSAGVDNTYKAGDVVTFSATYGEAVTVTGTPLMAINVGGTTVYANYISGSGTTTLVFNYTILAGQTDANGISIPTNAIVGSIADAAGNPASATTLAVLDDATRMVDAIAPTVVSVTDNVAGVVNENISSIEYTYTFSEPVTGLDVNDFIADNGGVIAVVGSGTTWTVTVEPAFGVASGNIMLALAAGAAQDLGGNNSAGHSQSNQVIDNVSYEIVTSITSSAGADNTYKAGDVITFAATSPEPIMLSGATAPVLRFMIGSTAVDASYTGMNAAGTALNFSYTVLAGQLDGVVAGGISSGFIVGGGVFDAAGNAFPTQQMQGDDLAHQVDGVAPTLLSVSDNIAGNITSSVTSITYFYTFDEVVTGFTAADFNISSGTITSVTGDGTNVIAVTITPDHSEADGSRLSITLNAGGYTDVPGNIGPQSDTNNDQIISNDTTAPTVTSIAITSNPGADMNYAVGDVVEFTVTFSEEIEVRSTAIAPPTLTVMIGGNPVQLSGWYQASANTLVYSYVVQVGDFDGDGISVAANSMQSNNIYDLSGNAANTSHLALADDPNHTVGVTFHTIVGTSGDDLDGAIWGYQLEPSGGPMLGTGPTAMAIGGNRLWAGDDLVQGLDGEDLIVIYQVDAGGNDTLDGGANEDYVSYDSFTSGITVNLASGSANLGAYGNQTLINIEHIFSGQGNDSLTGDTSGNLIVDRGGNDTIDGGDGDDRIYDADFMMDTINGGNGRDELSYSFDLLDRASGISVNLITGADSDGNTIAGIEDLRLTEGDDTAYGSSDDNQIQGLGGADSMFGLDGRDSLYAGEGNDSLDGGEGADDVYGDGGDDYIVDNDREADIIQGGSGIDTLDYSANTHYAATGLTIDLYHQATFDGDPANNNTLYDIENVIGTAGADYIVGTGGGVAIENNLLAGGDGNDTLEGLSGGDTLIGGNGKDLMIGGDDADTIVGQGGDNDVASYAGNSQGVTVVLGESGNNGSASDGDMLIKIDHLIGSAYEDSLIGNSDDNAIAGGDKNDTIFGGEGNDMLDGGDGDDVLDGSFGSDQLQGGTGNDTIVDGKDSDLVQGGDGNDVFMSTEDATEDLFFGDDGYDTVNYSRNAMYGITGELGGAAGTAELFAYDSIASASTGAADRFDSLDAVVASQFADDIAIIGSTDGSYSAGWMVQAGAGDDTVINAARGENSIYGEAGNDTLVFKGLGEFGLLDGGQGNDYISVVGTGNGSFNGGDTGTDTIMFANGANVAVYVDGATGSYADGAWSFDIRNFDHYVFGGVGQDTFIGSSADEFLDVGDAANGSQEDIRMGDGADTLRFTPQSDGTFNEINTTGGTYDGGDGIDWIDLSHLDAHYANLGQSYHFKINLSSSGPNLGFAYIASDSGTGSSYFENITNFENIVVGNGDGYVVMNGFDNSVVGGDGNTGLYGFDGNDTLYGMEGDDTLSGGAGADYLDGGMGVNSLEYQSSIGAISVNLSTGAASGGDAQGDTIVGQFTSIFGSSATGQDDTIIGNGLDNYIHLVLDKDSVYAETGNDTVYAFGTMGSFVSDYQLHGGIGIDTFSVYTTDAVSGSNVSLSPAGANMSSFEIINAGFNNNNTTLTLSAGHVLDLSETNILEVLLLNNFTNDAFVVNGSGMTLQANATVSDNHGNTATSNGTGLVTLGAQSYYAYSTAGNTDWLLVSNQFDNRIVT